MTRSPIADQGRARTSLDEFLVEQFGTDLRHPKLGRVAVRDDLTREHDNAYSYAVNTVRYLESGDLADGLPGGAIVVPKDGSPVHWAPTRWPVTTYLQKVRSGETGWSVPAGAEQIRYFGIVDPADPGKGIGGLLRRRPTPDGVVDEVFTRNLAWQPTEYFRKHSLGHNDTDPVEVSAAAAAELANRISART